MNHKKIVIAILTIALGLGAYYGSKGIVNKVNENYTETNPLKEEKKKDTSENLSLIHIYCRDDSKGGVAVAFIEVSNVSKF